MTHEQPDTDPADGPERDATRSDGLSGEPAAEAPSAWLAEDLIDAADRPRPRCTRRRRDDSVRW